jgi:phosphonoacetaldehyde hydrolase
LVFIRPNIRAQWIAIEGREPCEGAVYSFFDEFGPLQMEVILEYSQVISGVAETVSRWQSRGIRIGSSTGFTRPMLTPVLVQAAEQGYRPDASVCPDEVPRAARPRGCS